MKKRNPLVPCSQKFIASTKLPTKLEAKGPENVLIKLGLKYISKILFGKAVSFKIYEKIFISAILVENLSSSNNQELQIRSSFTITKKVESIVCLPKKWIANIFKVSHYWQLSPLLSKLMWKLHSNSIYVNFFKACTR